MIKKLYTSLALLVLVFMLSSWGGVGHSIINRKCPESFPTTMVGFSIWADSLNSFASAADNRKSADPSESPKHYIDIDNYSEFLSKGRIASTYDSIVSIHGSTFVVKNGTLPWATRNTYDLLVDAFKTVQWHKAMLLAADLGHYVGDGHMPLHITANYDGDLTNQSGIHSRYESTMVSSYQSTLAGFTGFSVNQVTNINKYILDYIYINHRYVDSVLLADTYAKNLAGNTNSTQYTQALWSKTRFTTNLMRNASHTLAELIYTAWVEAGKPAFGSKVPSGIEKAYGDYISVYPNPTKGTIHIEGDEVIKTEILDITGKSVGTFYTNVVDLGYLNNGIYILNIYSKSGLIAREKVLLAK